MPDSDDLRARIPGWGADLNKEDRPSVPKLKLLDTGAHWDFPERQPEKWPRERSVEHRFLTPVFGTAQPPSGLSDVLRRFAYRFSEGRAAHWMILLCADRVDAGEHHLRSLLTLRPDNPITETGIKTELHPQRRPIEDWPEASRRKAHVDGSDHRRQPMGLDHLFHQKTDQAQK